jgi:integrative and conjugative element protein (TIGR02256 family)
MSPISLVPASMTFIDSTGKRVKIGPDSLAALNKYIQNHPDKSEAGGVLLGRFIVASEDVVIDRVTVPMPGDKRSRSSFFRSASSHQKQIITSWVSSLGTCNYLGEWHTHPEPIPYPSGHDVANWKQKLKHDVFDSSFLLFVIVGTEQISIWKGKRSDFSLEKLIY